MNENENIDINNILTGKDPEPDTGPSNPDLKEIRFDGGRAPGDLNGGYRIIPAALVNGIIQDDAKGTLRGLYDHTATMGFAKINLQTNRYGASSAFPTDGLMYGTVHGDTSDRLRVYPEAYVIGGLNKAVTCAPRWAGSEKRILIPYTANMYNISHVTSPGPGMRANTSHSHLRWVKGDCVRICLGGITSGGLADWAFNADLMLGYNQDLMMPYPPGFLPVFVPQYGDTPLRRLQDEQLGRLMAAFMPWNRGFDSRDPMALQHLLEADSPELEEAVHDYAAEGRLGDYYVQEQWYNKVYDLYIKVLADTFIYLYSHSEPPRR